MIDTTVNILHVYSTGGSAAFGKNLATIYSICCVLSVEFASFFPLCKLLQQPERNFRDSIKSMYYKPMFVRLSVDCCGKYTLYNLAHYS